MTAVSRSNCIHCVLLTFSPHSVLEALFESTVLALIAVMLVDGAVPASSTGVRQVPSDRPLEEALATFAGECSVMLT